MGRNVRAVIGSTGGSTGAHLHGGVYDVEAGRYVNPTEVLTTYSRVNDKPLDQSLLTSPYSEGRVHPIHGDVRPHRGDDFAYPEGSSFSVPGARFVGGSYDKGGGGNIGRWEVSHKGRRYEIVGMHFRDPVTGKPGTGGIEPPSAKGSAGTGSAGGAAPATPAALGVDPAEIAAMQSVFDSTNRVLKETIEQSAALQKGWAGLAGAASGNPAAVMRQAGLMPVAPTPSPFASVFRGMDRGVLSAPGQRQMPQAPSTVNPYAAARRDTVSQLMSIYGVAS